MDRQPDTAVKDRELRQTEYKPGDLVIYTVTKQSPHPGPRARGIQPSEGGEDYAYVVDKFWMVLEVLEGDQVLLATRRGKRRTVLVSDPMLKKAGWWQRLRYRSRFPGQEVLSEKSSGEV
ncbi:MAG: hypothetical protein ACKPJD_29550 [Planctomycetaceae bacterium]